MVTLDKGRGMSITCVHGCCDGGVGGRVWEGGWPDGNSLELSLASAASVFFLARAALVHMPVNKAVRGCPCILGKASPLEGGSASW